MIWSRLDDDTLGLCAGRTTGGIQMDNETREEFRKVHSRFDRVEETLNEHGERLSRLEDIAQANRQTLAAMHEMNADHQERMARLEDAVDLGA